MNNKGFTLVELLAVALVLVLISMIAVPAFTRLFQDNADKLTLEDGQKLLAQAEYKISTDKDFRLSGKNTIVYPLKDLNINGDFVTDPDGGRYDASSYVKYTKVITCYRETIIESGNSYVYTNKTVINCNNIVTGSHDYRYTRDEVETYCVYLKGSVRSIALRNGCCVDGKNLNDISSVIKNDAFEGTCRS